jgi:hypothetical protein
MHLRREWVAESQTRRFDGEDVAFMERTVPPPWGMKGISNATNVAVELVSDW